MDCNSQENQYAPIPEKLREIAEETAEIENLFFSIRDRDNGRTHNIGNDVRYKQLKSLHEMHHGKAQKLVRWYLSEVSRAIVRTLSLETNHKTLYDYSSCFIYSFCRLINDRLWIVNKMYWQLVEYAREIDLNINSASEEHPSHYKYKFGYFPRFDPTEN